MLQAFANQTDVPEALREHYSKREDGKWHADIPDDHPSVKHNAKLLNEKKLAEAEVTQLKADLDSAKASGLPRGHVAVAKADAQLLDDVKTLGSVDEVKMRLAEHEALKVDLAKRQRVDTLRSVATDLGYNVDAFVLLPGLPEFESRDSKDGKKWFAKVTDDKGVVTERPANEFIESADSIKPLLPALKTDTNVSVPTSGGGTGSPKDPFAAAREYGKQFNESQSSGTNVLLERFGLAKSAS